MRAYWLAAAAAAVLALSGRAAGPELGVRVEAGKQDRVNTPVCVPLVLEPLALGDAAGKEAVVRTPDGQTLPAQLTRPGLLSEAVPARADQVRLDLHFVLPSLKAGESVTLRATLGKGGAGAGSGSYSWHETPGESIELRLGGRPVLRYMNAPLDATSPKAREATYKVFHHVFDPAGEELLTKGPGGQFTHHRGLFYGFSKTTYDGNVTVDTWHCSGDTHQAHQKVLAVEAGPVLGRHRVQIGWHGKGKKLFAVEEREVTVTKVPGGRLIDFASRVRPGEGAVKVDGDPQHAGFHFRASNEVSEKTAKQTYYLRPDGRDKPGATRNWPGQKGHVNLPWDAMSFVVGGNRYTVAYLDRPENPKEARFSERDYGRFGSYFVTEFTKDRPLVVAYRVWVQPGEMQGADVARLAADFVSPPAAAVK